MTVSPEETERLIREYGAARMKVAYAKNAPESVKQEAAREVQVTHYALRQAINRHHSGLGEIKMYLDTIVEHLTADAEGHDENDSATSRPCVPHELSEEAIEAAAEAALLARNLLNNAPAALPSGEAPKLTAEQVREAWKQSSAWQPVGEAFWQRFTDALNALLGSAPQKEQVDSVTYPKDGP